MTFMGSPSYLSGPRVVSDTEFDILAINHLRIKRIVDILGNLGGVDL